MVKTVNRDVVLSALVNASHLTLATTLTDNTYCERPEGRRQPVTLYKWIELCKEADAFGDLSLVDICDKHGPLWALWLLRGYPHYEREPVYELFIELIGSMAEDLLGVIEDHALQRQLSGQTARILGYLKRPVLQEFQDLRDELLNELRAVAPQHSAGTRLFLNAAIDGVLMAVHQDNISFKASILADRLNVYYRAALNEGAPPRKPKVHMRNIVRRWCCTA